MEYLIYIATLVCIYGILGLSLNLVVGETGLLSIAQAGFYGIGAYATALLLVHTGVNFFVAMALGMVLAGVIALFIGTVLSRFSGDYYALVSLGFNVIVFSVLLNWRSLTQGPLGIPQISQPMIFGFSFSTPILFLCLALILLLLVYLIASFITSSSFGRVLHAIREDEEAIAVFGYRTTYYKLAIFVISAMLAALAGALYASYFTYIEPFSFQVVNSIFILAVIILGGLSSHRGAVLGALVLVIVPEALRFTGLPSDIAAQMQQVFYGLILILLMLYRPQGLLGKFRM